MEGISLVVFATCDRSALSQSMLHVVVSMWYVSCLIIGLLSPMEDILFAYWVHLPIRKKWMAIQGHSIYSYIKAQKDPFSIQTVLSHT